MRPGAWEFIALAPQLLQFSVSTRKDQNLQRKRQKDDFQYCLWSPSGNYPMKSKIEELAQRRENVKLGKLDRQSGGLPLDVQTLHGPIRKASLFARERKRDSEEELLLKMADLGGGRHPVSAVRSKQLTRRAFWADPTIHYFSQVAVESREGSEELTIAQAHCLGGPDNSLLGPGRRGIS